MTEINVQTLARRAKEASWKTALLGADVKKSALRSAAKGLLRESPRVQKANDQDMAQGKKSGLSAAMLDRLALNPKRIAAVAQALQEIGEATDPVGEVVEEWTAQGGLKIKRVRVPIGVIGMIYESRPNVTVESAALCLKAGNSVILRGGSEAIHSNLCLADIFSRAVQARGVPEGAVQLIANTDRSTIYELCRMSAEVDLIIARGSEKMVKEIRQKSYVPVLGHGKGVCHVYVDRAADLKMAAEIAFNSKVQRPGVCNAMETLLVDKTVAKKFLPELYRRYRQAGVKICGDTETLALLPEARLAGAQDWSTEYSDLELSIGLVNGVEGAIAHIRLYGSGHTDAIVTQNAKARDRFINGVDSAAVVHNASTRVHDGGVFGLGAEIGISTQKLHARGTMGARELTSTKYVVLGQGQLRQ